MATNETTKTASERPIRDVIRFIRKLDRLAGQLSTLHAVLVDPRLQMLCELRKCSPYFPDVIQSLDVLEV